MWVWVGVGGEVVVRGICLGVSECGCGCGKVWVRRWWSRGICLGVGCECKCVWVWVGVGGEVVV